MTQCRHFLAIALPGFLLTPAIHAAAPVDVLLDPRASSADKFEAVSYLYRLGPLAAYAAPALARQSLYDMPQTRALALQALVKLVGEEEAKRLRIQAARRRGVYAGALPPQGLSVQLPEMADKWEDLPRGFISLRTQDREFRRNAVTAALRIWDRLHTLPPIELGFDAVARDEYVQALALLAPTLSPAVLRSAAEFNRALGLNKPDAVPLILAALAEPDAYTRLLVRDAAEQLFAPESKDPIIVRGIVEALTQEPEVSKRREAVANECLARMGPAARQPFIDFTLARLARGYSRAKLVLPEHVELTAFIKAAFVVADDSSTVRLKLAPFFDMLGADPAHAQATAVTFLTHDGDDNHEDESVRRAIAMLVAADRDRFDRHALLYLCIATGKPQSFNVLQALDLDTTEACKQMAQILRNVKTSRAAALKTLSFTGLHGPEIRPALEPLLEDPDEALRLAAATLLDRKDVLARMRVPELLRDLRSDVIDRRMIAARRLDDLGVEPKEITAALLRAVDRRDMPAREGLIAALEAAHASHKPTLEVLQRTADASDPAPRAYARAALREIAAAR